MKRSYQQNSRLRKTIIMAEQTVENQQPDSPMYDPWKRAVIARYETFLFGQPEGQTINRPFHRLSRSSGDQIVGEFLEGLRHGKSDGWIVSFMETRFSFFFGARGRESKGFTRAVLDDARRFGVHWTQWVSGEWLQWPRWAEESKAERMRRLASVKETAEMVAHSSELQTPSTSRLLQLPPELRLAILELVVDREHVMTDGPLPYPQRELRAVLVPDDTCPPPEVTRVNRQLRAEGLAAFYREAVFVMVLDNPAGVTEAQAWVDRIGDEQVGMLRHISLIGCARKTQGSIRISIQLCVDLSTFMVSTVRVWESGERCLPLGRLDPTLVGRLCKYVEELQSEVKENRGVLTGRMLKTRLLEAFGRECEGGPWWHGGAP